MIFRKNGMYYTVWNDRWQSIVAWHYYANSGCVLAEPNEAYDYVCDPFLNHYLLQSESGVVVDGEINP